MTQNFKGDALELKMQAVANPVFDLTNAALNDFYENVFQCGAFLLMLYDDSRMPFSARIPRAAFVEFIKQALENFPVTGSFESYLFVLGAVFGSESEIVFTVPAAGKLEIDVLAISSSTFDFIGREYEDGAYTFVDMVDDLGNTLTFRGLPGIETEYELDLLFSEIMPCGITPTISLAFYSKYDFIAEEGADVYDMIDHDDNQIIFIEMGG